MVLGVQFYLLLMPAVLSLLPADSALHVSAYTLTLVGKILCYAIVALALDLVWGYAGLLSLGHGLFFALGGYAFGMYLMRMIGHMETRALAELGGRLGVSRQGSSVTMRTNL